MKRVIGLSGCMGAGWMLLVVAAISTAQPPEMPKPGKEHELLSQFAGDWKVTAETVPAPGQEALKCEGMESAKMVGGFWLVGQNEAEMVGRPVSSILTLGYDPKIKKYVGTFLCSMDSTLWNYVGSFVSTGKKLTLETKGPSPLDHDKKAKFQEILELKDKDHKVFTSLVQGEDGKWTKMVTVEYRRKK